MNQAPYDQDLYTWSLQQSQLLRERKFDQVDCPWAFETFMDEAFWSESGSTL
ncbi:MAG: DUF29 family protein [Candidatus Thiothrix moscowensis]|nr:DUF29 family protein [Candidatus Thiothrix moscowensis]